MLDFFVLAFPIRAIWRLQMPLKRKFGVTIEFAVWGFVFPFPLAAALIPAILTFATLLVLFYAASCVSTLLPKFRKLEPYLDHR